MQRLRRLSALRWPPLRMTVIHNKLGFTLAEVLLGAMALSVAIAAILGAYIGQLTLNEHARNLSVAIQDANRVIERIRQQNTPCVGSTAPTALPPVPYNTAVNRWDEWLADTTATGGGGKSIQPLPNVNELVVLTAQNRAGTATWVAGSGENQIRVTAAVCWRHRARTIGECDWNGANLVENELLNMPTDTTAIDSPAMLTTLVTCR